MFSPANMSLKERKFFRGNPLVLFFGVSLVLALLLSGCQQANAKDISVETAVTNRSNIGIETAVSMPTATRQETSERSAPEFALPDLFKDAITIELSMYAGRPLVVNFWASWCAPCREEMPALQEMYEQNRDDGLVLLGINQTYMDDLESARNFVKALNLSFPNARDDEGQVSEKAFRVIGLPTTVFITRDGKIAHVQIGQLTDTQIAEFSQKLMLGEPFP